MLAVLALLPVGSVRASTLAQREAEAPLFALMDLATDDPRASLVVGQRQLAEARANGDVERQFWLWLGLRFGHSMLEQSAESTAAIDAAAALLPELPGDGDHGAAVELFRIAAETLTMDLTVLVRRFEENRGRFAALASPRLACAALDVELWLLNERELWAEAWAAAEALESCSRDVGDVHLEAYAAMMRGVLTTRVAPSADAATSAPEHFRRAQRILEGYPARFLRSLIAWEVGRFHRRGQDWERATESFQQALELSRELGDEVGEAAALVPLAQARIEMGQMRQAIELAEKARSLLRGDAGTMRRLDVQRVLLKAKSPIHHPSLAAEVERAAALEAPGVVDRAQVDLLRDLAAAQHALGRSSEAYATLSRSSRLAEQLTSSSRDLQMLRLEARYEAARREVENAELKLKSEKARLELAAETARRRALTWALVALSLILAVVVFAATRVAAHRRRMAFLALRDELTGLPNRRAILEIARQEWQRSRLLGRPFCVAVLDLDHFKTINDQYGHTTGDHVLRALARAATGALRGQDSCGRLGGEEFLLVFPNSSLIDLPGIFERLQQRFAEVRIEGLAGPHSCSFSMGAAQAQAEGGSIEALLLEADSQLYRAKSAGRAVLRSPVL